jgi:hypothetical protein
LWLTHGWSGCSGTELVYPDVREGFWNGCGTVQVLGQQVAGVGTCMAAGVFEQLRDRTGLTELPTDLLTVLITYFLNDLLPYIIT